MKSSLLLGVLIVSVGTTMGACATEAKLSIGDPAPKLHVAKWVQGEPVNEFATNHVYVVEFWATWCGPCVGAIPHLNELWQNFKDKGVIIIGQDVWDSDNKVGPFVNKMGAKMTYRVALDDKSAETNGFMADHWLRAAHLDGIPTAFVVNNQGRIAWIGGPMLLNEKLLNNILSGQYDLAKASAEHEKQEEENQRLQDEQNRLFSAMDHEKWNEAESVLGEILSAFPKFQNSFNGVRLRILLGQKKYDEAYKFAETFGDNHPTDAYRQNVLAWIIATQQGVKPRNMALAERLAEGANKAADGKDWTILDTLARVQFMMGKTNEAIVTEQRAADIAPDANKDQLKSFVTDYRHGNLPEAK